MKFTYSKSDPRQREADRRPRVSLHLCRRQRVVETIGLVDSGATISVLPYSLGLQLGFVWDESQANLPLAGIVSGYNGIGLRISSVIADQYSVDLAFAWVKSDAIPVILGQMNFFL